MSSLHLALALGGDRPSSPATWAHLVREAEVGLLDFVTLDTASPAGREEGADAALDPVQLATRLASTTQAIGLLPTVHAGLSDPWSIAHAVDSLDEVSGGRAGVHLRVPVPADENGWVRAVRRGWSSSTGSTGATTGNRGAASPVVALPGRVGRGPRALPADAADIGFVSPRTTVDAQQLVAAARTAGAPRHLLGDLVVVLDDDAASARGRWQRTAGGPPSTAPDSTRVFAGTPAQLADLALGWRTAGVCGLRLHPVDPDRDLRAITRGLVPELQRRGAFRRSYDGTDLRQRLAGSALVARSADHCTAA